MCVLGLQCLINLEGLSVLKLHHSQYHRGGRQKIGRADGCRVQDDFDIFLRTVDLISSLGGIGLHLASPGFVVCVRI